MQEKCGHCRQFTRVPENNQDLCGAWGQPTRASRAACEFFMPKTLLRKPAHKLTVP
ncbi:hypothetical protein [Motilimonas pumila]|uniref:hypothetical protein n=1 Tax=Motilimonas pumila TaxID=2303987 RepID=UPI0018E08F83|nr:hypothetical protein [Motilimonas pumila]